MAGSAGGRILGIGIPVSFCAHKEQAEIAPQTRSKAILPRIRFVIFSAELFTITMMSTSPFVAKVSDYGLLGRTRTGQPTYSCSWRFIEQRILKRSCVGRAF